MTGTNVSFREKNEKVQTEFKSRADFQTAISATSYGKFNLLLLLIFIPAATTIQIDSTLIAFIIPTASCDLNLDVTQKGLLNSMSFFGMLSTGFLWGFLLDTLGRRKILWLGCLAQTLIVWGQGFSTSFSILSVFKFFGGAVTGGTYVAQATYLLELHSTEHRGKIQMIAGMIYAGSNVIIPLISSAILPLNIKFDLYFCELHAWNILMLMGSVSPMLATIAYYFLPESPKFLMSMGRNDEALKVLRKIYRINTGNSGESYPIESLLEEVPEKLKSEDNKSWKEYLKSGWQQLSPLFGKQYIGKLLLVSVVQAIFGSGIHILRAYLPQIFQATHEYQIAHNGTTPNLCSILDVLRSNSSFHGDDTVCIINVENSSRVYLNSFIVAVFTMLSFVLAGTLIGFFKRMTLLTILGITACISINSLYFSQNTATTLAMSTLYLSSMGIGFEIFTTIVAVVFPTTLRAMAISVCLFMMRVFTIVGNNVLPVLVEVGCVPPFLSLGCVILVGLALSCLLPSTEKSDMK
ncbi:unnamed protein product [Ceutorhynchus assimilis]|uniref:Major facilitator superfamily (MFS) profile domain-containing protein n=1 Tax=Ceutorhynchus assimilis TaxID=467358 RepID=A0A9N9QME6_9CUCU|nr:unnamed protein product [Ceutorhynchus assimilis]